MKKPEKIAKKKKFIIEALKRQLDKHAYSYVSIQDVADEAGISKGGLRYYFPTKESLYEELIQDFFNQIEEEHLQIVSNPNLEEDRFFLSTLLGIERFVLNEANIKVFVNLMLYGLQDEKMRQPIKKFFRNHLELYKRIVIQTKENRKSLPPINRGDFDMTFLARIAQIIFLSAGLLEAIDPIGIEPSKLTRYVISLFEE
ncbi:MAG: TetR/AcrR family transcriptional regulator [Spirochaetes bacterium]|nr:TetR/AcrR family transcriptional regulator [Spirochaetota bacterium]